MKTTTRLFGLCILFCGLSITKLKAQPWYGQHMYKHDSTILSSAKLTSYNPGYVMAGFRRVRQVPLNQPDFAIDKVDGFGQYGPGNNFSNEYIIKADPLSCTSPAPVFKCSGISIIETKDQGGGETYAIAGCYDRGIFFATLDALGNVINQNFWALQNQSVNLSKPGLRESVTSPGKYYLCCGNYVMSVKFTGAQLWANAYNSIFMDCRDLIESPYNANELIVVGRADYAVSAADGMFMSLDASNGAPNYLNNYNISGWDSDDWFTCIQLANSPSNGGQGYVLGGRVYGMTGPYPSPFNNDYCQWMTKLDPSGNTLWSSLIQPFAVGSGNLAGNEIAQVYERSNPSGWYEYYGVAGSNFISFSGGPILPTKNLVVFKLDDNGSNSLLPNEFHYAGGGTAPNGYADLTAIETGGGMDDGIQAYGTRFATSSHYMAKAYFNGVSGCKEEINKITQIFGGPKLDFSMSIGYNAIPPCPAGLFLAMWSPGPNLAPICDFAPPVFGGSNARTVSIQTNAADNALFSVYPNPTNGKAVIGLPAAYKGTVAVTVSNILGQKIKEYSFSDVSGECSIQLDALQLKSGMYTVQVTAGTATGSYKIVYKAD